MAGKQFGEGKSIKISKASWKLLRARSVDLERPMTALVEEAVTAYLGGHIPLEVPLTMAESTRQNVCLHCRQPLMEYTGPFCGEACRQAWEAVQP